MPTINIRNAKDYNLVVASLNGDQPKALEAISDWLNDPKYPYFVLAGYAGTGKTYLTAAITKLIQQVAWGNIAVVSPTHQAKLVIHNEMKKQGVNFRASNISVNTIHAFLGMREDIDDDGNIKFIPSGERTGYTDGCDMLICDEVSMIGEELDMYLEDAWRDHRAKVLFVGDPMQIPPINEKHSTIFQRTQAYDEKFGGVAFLREVVRQQKNSKIIQLASHMREHLEKGDTLIRYPQMRDFVDNEQLFASSNIRKNQSLSIIMGKITEGDPRYMKGLAYRNETVSAINHQCRYLITGKFNSDLPLYLPGESLILTSPWLDESQKKVILPNNAEVVIQEIQEQIEGEGSYTYITNPLVVSCDDILGKGETILIKPVPHDIAYHNIVKILKDTAKYYRKGSYEAKTAWMEYYGFTKQYVGAKHSYAITAHRSQGSTYQHTIIDEADIFANRNRAEGGRVAYTALTRASSSVVILRDDKIK